MKTVPNRPLKDCDLEYVHLRLSDALILSSKRSTHAKKKRMLSLEKKNRETKQEKTKIKREN